MPASHSIFWDFSTPSTGTPPTRFPLRGTPPTRPPNPLDELKSGAFGAGDPPDGDPPDEIFANGDPPDDRAVGGVNPPDEDAMPPATDDRRG